jgi:hypothetical protein
MRAEDENVINDKNDVNKALNMTNLKNAVCSKHEEISNCELRNA